MGLLSLTKDGVSFLLDENDITRVYSLDGVVKVEYLKANGGTLDTIIVEESLATIDAASDELIELTSNGVAFLLNYTIIRQVLTEGSGSKVIYEKLQTQSVVVEETPTEINALINAPSTEPLRYKALISQNAPIASTSNVSMVAGQIWTLEIYSGLDGIDPFNGLELISGTIRVAGSKYRSNVDLTISFSTTEMSYDGSPYIVSTDANGDFNPFINTTGEVPTYSYLVAGRFSLNSPNNLYLLGKVVAKIGQTSDDTRKNVIDAAYPAPNSCDINTFISGTRTDGLLYYSLIEIEVYP